MSMLQKGRAAVMNQPTISESDLNQLKHEYAEAEPFKMQAAHRRNVIMVGRTRAGKSTAVGVLKSLTFTPPPRSIFSQTKGTNFESFTIAHGDEDDLQRYNINIIDTPGLFERVELGQEERSNEVIASLIRQCMERQITRIHLVLIFATFVAGINKDDIEACKKFVEELSGPAIRIRLCITYSENQTEKDQQDLVQQLLNTKEPHMRELANNVFFMGCVAEPHKAMDAITLVQQYDKVQTLRVKLLKALFDATLDESPESTDGSLRHTKLFQGGKDDALLRIREVCQVLEELKDVRESEIDPADELAKKALSKLRNAGTILSTFGALVQEPDVSAEFAKMQQRVVARFQSDSPDSVVFKVLREVFAPLAPATASSKSAAAVAPAPDSTAE